MAHSAGDDLHTHVLVGIRSGQHAEGLIHRMGLLPLIAQKVAELRRSIRVAKSTGLNELVRDPFR